MSENLSKERVQELINDPNTSKKMQYYWKNREKIIAHNKKRIRTLKGSLITKYKEMRYRSNNPNNPHIPIEDFMFVGLNSKEYLSLHETWKKSGYNRKLAPSVDRIDCRKGYCLDNIQFITLTANTSKGLKEYPRGCKTKKKVLIEKDGISICFLAATHASRFIGVSDCYVGKAIKTKSKVKGWKLSSIVNNPEGAQS